MAVRASNIAFCDLRRDRLPRGAIAQEVGHVRGLVTTMVEIEDDRVRLATVDARVLDEIREHAARECGTR